MTNLSLHLRTRVAIAFLIACLVLIAIFFASGRKIHTTPNYVFTSKFQEEEGAWRKRFIKDPLSAYATFLTEGRTLSYDDAHQLAHLIGEVLYKTKGARGIAHCGADFSFGCYHAFLGQELFAEGLTAVSPLSLSCRRASDPLGCMHGIGHGLLAYLGDEKYQQALNLCDELHQGSDIGGCFGGVFMEYYFATMQASGGSIVRPMEIGKAEEPCAHNVAERFKKACYYELPPWWRSHVIEEANGISPAEQFKKVGARCEHIEDTEFRDICFRGIGNIIGPESSYKPATMRVWCAVMPSASSAELCFREALYHMFDTATDTSRLKEMCNNKEITFADVCGRL